MPGRLLVLAGLVAVALLAPTTGAHAELRWRPDVDAARTYLRDRDGTVSFAVRTPRHLWGHRSRLPARSASVVKAMLLAAYLDDPRVRRRPLRPRDRRLLEPMVRDSDNATATRVREYVGDAGLYRLARRVGMGRFRVGRRWGYSRIDAREQTRFLLRVDATVPPRHRAYALRLLATVVPAQRWGIAAVRPAGWALYFKGGWGSGPGLVDHQVALLRRGRERVAVAILTRGNPDHEYGKATLREVARRLLRGLDRARARAPRTGLNAGAPRRSSARAAPPLAAPRRARRRPAGPTSSPAP